MSSSVVLPGSGPLSRSVCYTRAAGSAATAVTVVARDEARAAEPAYAGNARAALTWSRAVPGAGPTAPPHAVLAVLTAEVVAQTRRARPLAARDSAALLIRNLLTDAEIRTKVPGGYPVRTAEDIQLDLPAGLTAADAVAWNRAAARLLALRARPRGRADP